VPDVSVQELLSVGGTHGLPVKIGRMQFPLPSHVPCVARHPVMSSCEHDPPAFRGVSWHCPVLKSQVPTPQSVDPHVLERIGHVVVAMRDNFAIVDSRTARPELLALLGLHGSLTHEEVSIPLLHAPARDSA